MKQQVRETTIKWKEVIDNYLGFMESLVDFQKTAPDIPPDLFGPEMQLVYQRGLQRQKPVFVLEHLEWEHVQKGDLSHLYPREPEPTEPAGAEGQSGEEEEKPSKEPLPESEDGKSREERPTPAQKKPSAK